MLLIVPIDAVWGRIFCDPAHRLWLWKCVGGSDRHIRIFLEVLYLFHDFTEYLRAVLRRVAVLHKANLNIQLKLIADILNQFLGLVKKYTEVQELTAEIIREFVERIYVYKAEKIDGHRVQRIKVVWNYIGELPGSDQQA